MTTETEVAFAELLETVSATHARMVEQLADDPQTLLEAHKWVLSILQVAAEVNLWADKARPRFVEIVGPYKKWGGDNADAFYCYAPIDPTRTYRVRLDPGDAVYMSLTVYGGPDDGRYSTRIVGSVNSEGVKRDAEGAIHIVISPEDPAEPGVLWIRLEPDAVAAITRDYLNDPRQGRRAVWHIEADDPPETYRQDDADLARRIRAATTWVREQSSIVPIPLGTPNAIDPPYPVPTSTFGWAAGDAAYAMGAFELADDEALVIRGRSPECVFWNMCLWNRLLHTYNYDYERVTINGAEVQYEPDGSWIIVISARRPAHPNWVSTAGHGSGRIWFRWFLPTETPEQPQVEVLPGGHRMSVRPPAVSHRRPGDPSLHRRGPRHPRLHGRSGIATDPRSRRTSWHPPARKLAWRTSVRTTSSSASGCCARPCIVRAASTAPASCSNTSFITGLLKNRLLIEDLLGRHPEILDEQIVAPIIICGLPRTGTTHLHNLMSADPALRSLPYWESLEPVLPASEVPETGAPDPRLERTDMALSFLNTALPYFNRMHEMTVEHTHEEIQLLAIDFSTMLFETTAPMTIWRDAYLARDQRPSYAYLRKVLQVLQWLRGGTRWVLKTPQHLEQFPALVDTFPDATFVVTHRDPVSVTASMVTMIAYTARLTTGSGRRGRHRAPTGPTGSSACCAAVPKSATSCRPTGRSTCTSTSSWQTTSPWSAVSTSWRASLWTHAPRSRWPPSWRPTPAACTEP